VDYFMVTFNLPAECRGILWHIQKTLYSLLFESAISKCRDFAKYDEHLKGDIGLTGVPHT
jgi:cation transport regulator ChaB